MPKKEREMARERSVAQQKDIETKFGAITGEAQAQLPDAKGQASAAYGKATGAAEALFGGEANPYAAGLAEGTANKYATDLAVTGGISEDEAQAMETAATRNVRSVYDVLGAEAQRKAAITGGYGGTGGYARLARQAGQTAAEAGTNARAEIAKIRQGGRVSGAGMVGEQQIAGAGLTQQQVLEGSRQLTQLYGISQDQANYVMDYILKATATGIQLSQQDIAYLVELSKQKGTFGAIAEGVGQIGGAAAGVMGGVAGLK